MIDLHTHVLPEVDDGAENYKESIKMIKEAKKQGITHMVATPHYLEDEYQLSPEEIKSHIKKLKNKMQEYGINNLEILPGAEVFITPDLGQKIQKQKITTINNSHYILVEFPAGYLPDFVEEVFYDLEVMGYYPIISHPERYDQIIADKYNLYKLLKGKNVYAQLNAGSLLGIFVSEIKKTAVNLLENNYINFIASDTHSFSRRKQYLQEGIEYLNKLDESYAKIFLNNARKVLNDEKLQVPDPQLEQPPTFWDKVKNIFHI